MAAKQTASTKLLKRLEKLDTMTPDLVKAHRLYHPTFQRIFGRAKEARGAGPTLGPPLYAITRSNPNPESAEVRPLSSRKDGSWFCAELDCS
jgi:hypothetical protein